MGGGWITFGVKKAERFRQRLHCERVLAVQHVGHLVVLLIGRRRYLRRMMRANHHIFTTPCYSVLNFYALFAFYRCCSRYCRCRLRRRNFKFLRHNFIGFLLLVWVWRTNFSFSTSLSLTFSYFSRTFQSESLLHGLRIECLARTRKNACPHQTIQHFGISSIYALLFISSELERWCHTSRQLLV